MLTMYCIRCCCDCPCLFWMVRLKFKQETAALRTELQKHQLESKTGNKGMELATKELEALK